MGRISEYNTMNEEQQEEYKEKYGSIYNTLLRTTKPTEERVVKDKIGYYHTIRSWCEQHKVQLPTGDVDLDQTLLELPIGSHTNRALPQALRDLHKNYRRIVAI